MKLQYISVEDGLEVVIRIWENVGHILVILWSGMMPIRKMAHMSSAQSFNMAQVIVTYGKAVRYFLGFLGY